MVDLLFRSTLEQLASLQRGDLSPLDLTQAYLKRIEQVDGALGSYWTVLRENALAQAELITEQWNRNDPGDRPPLLGLPVSIKDLHALQGAPASLGVAALRQRWVDYDDGAIARLRTAGCVFLGKTATSQLGTQPITEVPGFAPTRNPWDLSRTAGGSSGGAAAALAAGLCAAAHGSDGGGSIRGPAFCCGLVGLKAARGRISNAPVGESFGGLATHGMLSRTVADAALFLDVLSGYLPGDPYTLPLPEVSFLQQVQTAEQLKPQRIAWVRAIAPFPAPIPEIEAALTRTASQLEQLGHSVEPIDLDLSALLDPFIVLWRCALTAVEVPLPLLDEFNQWLIGNAESVGDYLRAQMQLQICARQLVHQLQPYAAVLLPTYLQTAPPVGAWDDLSPEARLQAIIDWVAPCPLANATGLPAIALPTGLANNGLPIGVQLLGHPAGEGTLLQLAAQLEQRISWQQIPPAGLP